MTKKDNQPTTPLDDPLGLGDVPPAGAGADNATKQNDTPPENAGGKEESSKKEKKPRQSPEERPKCPYCSKDGKVVLCKATSTRAAFTYYACPNDCGYSEKKARPQINQMLKRQRDQDENNAGFSAR